MSSQLTNLSIINTEHGEYKFHIMKYGDRDIAPYENLISIRVNHSLIEDLCELIEQTADNVNAGLFRGESQIIEFMKGGSTLYRQIAEDRNFAELKEELQNLNTPLLISTNEPGVPWELLHDGEEFLGIKHIISRKLYGDMSPPSLPSKEAPNRCLIIADPTGEFPELKNQAQELLGWLDNNNIECTPLFGKRATRVKIAVELATGDYDIIYYSGHVKRVDEEGNEVGDDEPGEYALILSDGPLRAREAQNATKGVSIAFINGCRSAASVESLTGAFLRKGTRLVIGTIFEVPPIGAGQFAKKFYERILAGETVGEALRTARIAVQVDEACGPSWASFVMYGDPRLQVVAEPLIVEERPKEKKQKQIFFSEQDLPEWLPKGNFENTCWVVIEDAIVHARATGVLGSPLLFAAMLKGEDRGLWNGLKAQGAKPETLQRIFDIALKVANKITSAKETPSKLQFSESAEQILRQAQEIARKRGAERKTEERDLQLAFVASGGGRTGELLRKAKVNFELLESFLRRGTVELDDAGKQAMDTALQVASKLGSNVCGTPHLFWGLMSLEGGLTQEILAEQSVTTELLQDVISQAYTQGNAVTRQTFKSDIQWSSNLDLILREAERIARAENAQYIGERHLLSAFLIVGGGSMSQILEKAGIDLDGVKRRVGIELSLPHSLGPLRQDECDTECWHVIQQSMETALHAGRSMVDTAHLFLALLKGKGCCASDALRKQGISPEQVRIVFQQELAPKMIDEPRKINSSKVIPSDNTSQILQLAKEMTEKENQEKVTEAILWRAFVEHGGGSTGEFLRKQGVAWEALAGEIFLEYGQVDLERFDEDAKEALNAALRAADEMRQGAVGTPHLLLGLLSIKDGCTQSLLIEQGVDPMDVRNTLERAYTSTETSRARRELKLATPFLSERVIRILTGAEAIARSEQNEWITERHIVLSFLRDGGGNTATILTRLGANLLAMKRSAESSAQAEGLTSTRPTPLLNQLGRDLTQEAKEGRLRPVIGREKEIERMETILLRATKNAPLLVGDAGVGKTAVVEGFAQKIAANQVAPALRGMRIIELPVSGLVSGTTYRGDFEKRMERIIQEVERSNVILFIDELHTLVGAGAAGHGSLDASNILKPFLARGDVKCIGATTIEEYRRYIEPDTALARRFQPVRIEEPTPEETIQILHGLRESYEKHFALKITDEAIEIAVKLSVRYLLERRLPDKACDVLEEACASAKMKRSGEEGAEATESVSISKADIAEVISEMTGISLGEIDADEQHRLKNLEESLKKRIVGQDGAISSVSGTIRSARVELRRPNRPKAVFIFAGPSGVGKTELAKALAAELFGADDALIQLNMSEFMEPHSVSKLIGAPAGYIGHDKEGQLTSVLRRKPDCIVLLDEFEKADAQVANLFLQLFDEGRITDAQGHVINAKNALFILTCNLGADSTNESGMGFQRAISEDAESYRKKVVAQVRKHFPTEFINRVDEIIVFDHLGKEQIREIATRELAFLAEQLKKEHGISVTFEESAVNSLVEKGLDRNYGARALLRVIDDNVRKLLSSTIIDESPSVVTVTADEEGIKLLAEECI